MYQAEEKESRECFTVVVEACEECPTGRKYVWTCDEDSAIEICKSEGFKVLCIAYNE